MGRGTTSAIGGLFTHFFANRDSEQDVWEQRSDTSGSGDGPSLDEQVLGPTSPPKGSEAEVIRGAIADLAAGRDQQALDTLRGLPRQGEASQWVLLLRGLAAFWAGDERGWERAWSRLEEGGACARIAQQFADAVSGDARCFEAVAEASGRRELLPAVRRVQERLDAADWEGLLKELPPLREQLATVAPEADGWLTAMVYASALPDAIQEVAESDGPPKLPAWVRRLESSLQPPREDPRWRRFFALICEEEADRERIGDAWQRYLKDLPRIDSISEADRPLARAVLLVKAARPLLNMESDPFGMIRESISQTRSRRSRAIRLIRDAIEACPDYRGAHISLADAYGDSDDLAAAAKVLDDWVARHPNDVGAMREAAHYVVDFESRSQLIHRWEAILALRPADSRTRLPLERQLVAGIFEAVRQDEFDEADDRFQRLRRYAVPQQSASVLAGLGVVVEAVRDQLDESAVEDLVQSAAQTWDCPEAAVWFGVSWLTQALGDDSTRSPLITQLSHRAWQRWHAWRAEKPTSRVAGGISQVLTYSQVCLLADQDMAAWRRYSLDAVNYLGETTRLKYEPEDLVAACHLLGQTRHDPALLGKLANKGRNAFPDRGLFVLSQAVSKICQARSFDPRLLASVDELMNEAERMVEGSTHPLDDGVAELTQNLREIVHDSGRPFQSSPILRFRQSELSSTAAPDQDEDEAMTEDGDDRPVDLDQFAPPVILALAQAFNMEPRDVMEQLISGHLNPENFSPEMISKAAARLEEMGFDLGAALGDHDEPSDPAEKGPDTSGPNHAGGSRRTKKPINGRKRKRRNGKKSR